MHFILHVNNYSFKLYMKKILKEKIKSFTEDQRNLYFQMQKENKLQICIPTGSGKGYIMMIDLLNQLVSTKNIIFAISSHRLMLNTQHLNDIFVLLSPIIGKVGFIFVGSSKYDVTKFQTFPEYNRKLRRKKLSYNELVKSTTSTKEVDYMVKTHLSKGRKVIIITTYHSLNRLKDVEIDTIYNDEAHTLASEQEMTLFKDNYLTITPKRSFFMTATPKDCSDSETRSFLMNNSEIFGKRIGLNFKECVEKGYIVKPVIHFALPENFDPNEEFNSISNMVKLIKDTYIAHSEFINKHSCEPEKIAAKILVKCPSVDEMWKIHKELLGKMQDVKICAGASRNDNSNFTHYIDNEGIVDRSNYLEKIQNFTENEKAIVLHFDTMSEGINVAGFTGVEFLGGKIPTIYKLLQNTGRATRLHKQDRDNIQSGIINTKDYTTWVKPYCAVIIPFWDHQSEFTSAELARQIKSLRDNFSYDPVYYVSIGTDMGKSDDMEDLDILNKKNERRIKFKVIEEVKHFIEDMDNKETELKEKERIKQLDKNDWFKLANG